MLFSLATLVWHMGYISALFLYYLLAYITMHIHLLPSGATEEGKKVMQWVVKNLYSTQPVFRSRYDFHVLDLFLIQIEGQCQHLTIYFLFHKASSDSELRVFPETNGAHF